MNGVRRTPRQVFQDTVRQMSPILRLYICVRNSCHMYCAALVAMHAEFVGVPGLNSFIG
jgi:hypothetical protein